MYICSVCVCVHVHMYVCIYLCGWVWVCGGQKTTLYNPFIPFSFTCSQECKPDLYRQVSNAFSGLASSVGLPFLILCLYFLIVFEGCPSHTLWFNILFTQKVCTKLATFDLVLYISFFKVVSSLMYIFDYSRKQVGSFTNWYESTWSLLVMLTIELVENTGLSHTPFIHYPQSIFHT